MTDALRLRLLRWFLVCVILVAIGLIVVNTAAQMTDVQWNDRRISALESQKDSLITGQSDLSGRVLVLESDMSELKWQSRTSTAALVGQFAGLLIWLIKRKQQPGEA